MTVRGKRDGRAFQGVGQPVVPGAYLAPNGVLQLRTAKATDWAGAAPVLAAGEMVVVLDDTTSAVVGVKVGDGSTGWSSLVLQSLSGGAYAPAVAAIADVVTIATSSGALVVGQHNPVDASGGTRAMTLANATGPGRVVSVEKSDSSANTVTVTLNLRGSAGAMLTLYWQNESIELRSKADGSWWPTTGHKTKASIDAEITALGNGTFARPQSGRICAIGDSITAANTSNAAGSVAVLSTQQGDNYLTHLCASSGGRLLNGGVIGHAGETTASLLSDVIPALLALPAATRPSTCIVLAGANDAITAVPLATTAANLTAIYTALRNGGIEPIAAMLTPNGTNSTIRAAQRTVSAWVAHNATRQGLQLVDFYGPVADPVYPGDYQTAFDSSDHVHPSRAGHQALGQALWSQMSSALPAFSPFKAHSDFDPTDMLTGQGSFKNDGNADGLADGWTNSSSGTPAFTLATRTGVVGKVQKLAGGQPFIARSIFDSTLVGHRLALTGRVWTSGANSGSNTISLFLYDQANNAICAPMLNFSTNVTDGFLYAEGIVPAGATTLRVVCNGDLSAGSAFVELAEVTLVDLTALGLT